MRIIGGSARGRRLMVPGGAGRGANRIRPTSDRARESLFNILTGKVGGSTILDLFAGTGAVGLEALSRGAEQAVLVDNNPEALRLIRKNIEICSFARQAICLRIDLAGSRFPLDHLQAEANGFDLVFMDPPYSLDIVGSILEKLSRGNILTEKAVVIAEVRKKEKLPREVGNLRLFDQRSYGEAGFWLYTAVQDE